VLLTDDATIRAMNHDYRGKDRPTDVLSFPQLDAGQESEARLLGDVVISKEQAAAQAARAGHPLADELALLAVHGTLHLIGFEDGTESGRRRMWALQEEVLKRLRRAPNATVSARGGRAAARPRR
jgi:probable rRNA maturation factor